MEAMEPLSRPSTFTLFPRLPVELRIAIFQYALPTRILTVRTIPAPCAHPFGRPAFASIDPPPALLSVNRESREEALKTYVILHDPYSPRFYFNSERDTIFFDVACPSWITILYDLNFHRPTSPSAVRSIALLNESMSAGLFAATVLRCGILEVFLVARYWRGMPNLWPLLPRVVDDETALDLYRDGDLHRKIIQKLGEARALEYPAAARIPIVTAVKRDFWDSDGVRLRGTW